MKKFKSFLKAAAKTAKSEKGLTIVEIIIISVVVVGIIVALGVVFREELIATVRALFASIRESI